MTATRWSC